MIIKHRIPFIKNGREWNFTILNEKKYTIVLMNL